MPKPKKRATRARSAKNAPNVATIERRDHRAEMTERLIAHLEAGTAPWQKSWTAARGGRPYNPLSADPRTASGERGYSGINRVNLMIAGMVFGDDRWCTRKQAEANGYTLRDDQSRLGTTIEVWKPYTRKKTDETSATDGEDERVRLGVRFFTLYNAAQFENFPALEPATIAETWSPIARAEALIAATGAVIVHSTTENTPHYAPGLDRIVMPNRERFTAEGYYDTLSHELAHWTGHKSRLNRLDNATFGTESYAREELVAEIASLFLSAETHIPHNTEQHAAYVSSWIRLLKDDKHAVARAAAAASKAVDHILAYSAAATLDAAA